MTPKAELSSFLKSRVEPGTPSADAMRLLGSWAATEAAESIERRNETTR